MIRKSGVEGMLVGLLGWDSQEDDEAQQDMRWSRSEE